MFILGLQGSPRKGGNTDTLLAAFMDKAAAAGAMVRTIQVDRAGIASCRGCGYCETHGTCVIKDDPMSTEIFGLLRASDVVVAATPVFFYGFSAQLKLLIDRCQTLWSRKYVYKLKDPLAATRQGVLLSVGASRGRQLFDGIHLTARYFFDGIDARYDHSLTYRGVEAKGAIRDRQGLDADIDAIIEKCVRLLARRPKLLFVSGQGACRAPMAAAMAQMRYGDRIRCGWAAVAPAGELSTPMIRVMQAAGVDLGYQKPASIDDAFHGAAPQLVVAIGRTAIASVAGGKRLTWDIPSPQTLDDASLEKLRGEIGKRVDRLQQWLDDSPETT